MITVHDAPHTIDLGKYYAIIQLNNKKNIQKFLFKNKAKFVNKNFSYNSRSNPKFLNVSEIRQMLKKEKLI